jgi:hypothetical protein
MGMYTQIRGWLNVESIGKPETYYKILSKLEQVKKEYKDMQVTSRNWVANDTSASMGGNGSVYIFFGTELKNYEDDAENWIKYLIAAFPSAEGRIDFQYESEDWQDENSSSKYWLIRNGKIVEERSYKTWCIGYGNKYK